MLNSLLPKSRSSLRIVRWVARSTFRICLVFFAVFFYLFVQLHVQREISPAHFLRTTSLERSEESSYLWRLHFAQDSADFHSLLADLLSDTTGYFLQPVSRLARDLTLCEVEPAFLIVVAFDAAFALLIVRCQVLLKASGGNASMDDAIFLFIYLALVIAVNVCALFIWSLEPATIYLFLTLVCAATVCSLLIAFVFTTPI